MVWHSDRAAIGRESAPMFSKTIVETARPADADWHTPSSTCWGLGKYQDGPICQDNKSVHYKSVAENRYGPSGKTTWRQIVSSRQIPANVSRLWFPSPTPRIRCGEND